MKSVLTLLAKSVLLSLWLKAAASATDATIQMKVLGIIWNKNEEVNDIMKIVKSLK